MFTWNVAPAMLLWCSDNTQSFVHDRSNSISQFISGESRNHKKMLRHLREIVTSTFKAGTNGRSASPSFPGRSGVFPTVFILYLNDLPFEALSSKPSDLPL